MNSEELEQSLRAEFENYLKDVVAEMRQSVSDFQEKINADFDKHKEQLADSLRELDQKVGSDKELEVSFTETVAEHLKLARDEGASITAAAIAEAEELAEPEDEGPDFVNLSQAISDISSKDSQSEILKALVNHAAEFTPRGAFFIVKNEHLVGWRVFGREEHEDPKVVREVFFPVATNTALSASVESLGTVSDIGPESEDDVMYRDKLGFEDPERMYAVPLIARGRGVAVLYADNGTEGHSVNIAAIEALMRVAGLTVEVLASAPPMSRQKEEAAESDGFSEPSAPESDYDASDSGPIPSADDYSGSDYSPATDDSSEGGFATEYQTSTEAVAVEEAKPEEADSYQFQPIAPAADIEPAAETAETVYEEVVEEPVVSEEAGFESEDLPYETPVSDYDETSFDAEHAERTETSAWDDSNADAELNESYATDDSLSSELEAADEPVTAFEAYDAGTEVPFAEPEVEATDTYEFETDAEAPAFEESTESPAFEESFETPAFEESMDSPGFEESSEAPAAFEESMDSPGFEESSEAPAAFEESMESPGFEEPEEAPAGTAFEDAGEAVTAFDDTSTETDIAFEQPETADEIVAEDTPAAEVPAAESSAPPVRSRFADRNLDLPIEVSEDERRLHNDARRFARLLVSEIKLYNEQKVKEGRESSDLYERLREAIDRSREMYDKRVQPPVAAKFDYFNYELVNTLAEGDEGKLGGSYPGAAI